MYWIPTVAVAAFLVLAPALVVGQDTAPAAPSAAVGGAPATPPATPPATAPAPAGEVVATVGATAITRAKLDAPLGTVPPDIGEDRRQALRERVLADLIVAELTHVYVAAKNVPCDANDLAAAKDELGKLAAQRGIALNDLMAMVNLTDERLRDQVRLKKLAEQAVAKEKVDSFIQAHPSCFNGTKVQASHILIACQPVASTAEQKAAVAKLTQLAADIRGGKTSFAEAARAHSACPSGKDAGGDLGEFEFTAMVPPFALKAFEMKVGEMSPVVRTQFGFHLIQVTQRAEGTGKPGQEAPEAATNALLAQLQNEVFDQALTVCPITLAKP